jgi:peptide chain release factor subunit 1
MRTAATVALTDDLVRELAAFKGQGAPVLTCYLDVDGRRYVRPHDYEVTFERMARPVRERQREAARDLKRIEDYVKGGFDRSSTRGLALFSCVAAGYWRSVHLPLPVYNRLTLNQHPQVRQLEAIVERAERYAVLLADRQRARLFVFRLGELVEWSERLDRLPRHEDDGGEASKDQLRDHADSASARHLRQAASAAFEVFQERAFDHLVVGAPHEIANALERALHPYLRERIAARLTVAVNAREDEVRQAVLDVEAEVEKRKEAAAVERLREAAGSNGTGAIGLDAVLDALVQRRVETLLVSDGFEAPGWHCAGCSWLGAKGPSCPVCTRRMEQVDDVVEEAVQEALNQSCRVEVCYDNADLDVLGRVGALLRF